MKNKEIKILEFGTCWPILFENISETVRDSGNRRYFTGSSQHKQFKEKTHPNWMKNKNYTSQISEISEFGPLLNTFSYAQSITYNR